MNSTAKDLTIFLFITSLNNEEHELDRIDATLPFCNEKLHLKPKSSRLKDLLFPSNGGHFIDASYCQLNGSSSANNIVLIKINGNTMCDEGQNRASIRNYWNDIKNGKLNIDNHFFKELTEAIIDHFSESNGTYNISLKTYIHWSTSAIYQAQKTLKENIRQPYQVTVSEDKNETIQWTCEKEPSLDKQDKILTFDHISITTTVPESQEKAINLELKISPYSCYSKHEKPYGQWKKIEQSKDQKAFIENFYEGYKTKDFEGFESAVIHKLQFELIKEGSISKLGNLCYKPDSNASSKSVMSQKLSLNSNLIPIDDYLDVEWKKIKKNLHVSKNLYPAPSRFKKEKPIKKPSKRLTSKALKSEFLTTTLQESASTDSKTLIVKFTRLWTIDGEDTGEVFCTLTREEKKRWKYLIEQLKENKWGELTIKDYEEVIEKKEVAPDLIIALAEMKDFNDSRLYTRIAERSSFHFTNQEAVDRGLEMDYYPVLTIGLMNIMVYYHEKDDPRFLRDDDKIKNAYHVYKVLNLDKRFRFFDSSIWFRYTALTQDFTINLASILTKIHHDSKEKKVYRSAEAVEYLEFQLRLLAESYFVNTENRELGPYVTPFIFHSETRMKWFADRELAAVNEMNWNILLVDDKADTSLFDVSTYKPLPYSKLDIIKYNIEQYSDGIKQLDVKYSDQQDYTHTDDSDKTGQVNIEWVTDIDRAFEKITEKDNFLYNASSTPHSSNQQNQQDEHDLLLLTYIFDFNKDEGFIENENEVRYGFDLIANLKRWIENEESQQNYSEKMERALGPMQKLNILPVSVYSGAMQAKLQDLGIPLSHEHWDIGISVDPISTPELFRYRFYYQLRRQLNKLTYIEKEKIILNKINTKFPEDKQHSDNALPAANSETDNNRTDLFEREKIEKKLSREYNKLKNPKSLLLKYFKAMNAHLKSDETSEGYRYAALLQFPKIVELGVRFKRLCKHQKKSPLARTIIKNHFFGLDAYSWDHLQNLVYLLTYGTFQQKQEMWEEYVFLKRSLNNSGGRQSEDFKAFQECLKQIATHIHQLG